MNDGITSAFCLRCNAWRGSLGLEPTPELYVQHLVEIFREVRRVLRDDGTLWLNMGDSYAGGNYRGGGVDTASVKQRSNAGTVAFMGTRPNVPIGLKPKDLCGIPWRVAFALQADGWWLRSDIIWHKPNPMPESVRDRPTKAHEYLFLLAKSAKYYYDQDAIREPLAESTLADSRNATGRHTQGEARGTKYEDKDNDEKPSWYRAKVFVNPTNGRNKRTVWTIATQPYSGAHFATFPEALVEPCIKAGSAEGDIVLDSFSGAGTALMVADRLGRGWFGIELNEEYVEMALKRLEKDKQERAQLEMAI